MIGCIPFSFEMQTASSRFSTWFSVSIYYDNHECVFFLFFFFSFFFFARSSSMIRQIVWICKIVDWFLWKTEVIFPKNFLDFRLAMNENQGIVNLRRCSSKCYASVVLTDSDIAFLGERENAVFLSISLLCFVYKLRCVVGKICRQIFLSFVPQWVFRRGQHLFGY